MSIGVIGCGLMGNGIIHSLAINGQRVIAVKHHSEDNSFLDYINKELKKNVEICINPWEGIESREKILLKD